MLLEQDLGLVFSRKKPLMEQNLSQRVSKSDNKVRDPMISTYNPNDIMASISMQNTNGTHRRHALLAVLSIIMTTACVAAQPEPTATAPHSLADLFVQCGLPVSCDSAPPCLGQIVFIEGMLDRKNVFDQQHYPTLHYEKFTLKDVQGHSIEVWPQAANNKPIFDKLARRPGDRIVVTGRLAAVRLPIGNRCRWGLKVLIDDPSQIEF